MEGLKGKLREVKERLLDPFRVEGLEEEIGQLLEMVRRADRGELSDVEADLTEIKGLLMRNLEIISGALKPLLDRGGMLSRRV